MQLLRPEILSIMLKASVLLLLPALAHGSTMAVFGHLVPDTDTVTSAMIYEWELKGRGIPATAYRLGELNPETAFVLKKFGVEVPPLLSKLEDKQNVAIVDTNNPEELPKDLKNAKIHSVVDHHKLSGLTTGEPLEIDIRPLCSATSILYARSKLNNMTPPPAIAGLMLAGILSDSLEFRSPTTTETDKVHAQELAKLAQVDIREFADGMFEAKAQVDHLTPEELIMMDTKIFKLGAGAKKVRVSVLETTKPAAPLKLQSKLVEAMQGKAKSEELDDVLFFVVDIIKEEATFVSSSPTASKLVERAWNTSVKDGLAVLPGVLSRKKQIIPKLEDAVKAEL